MAQINIKDFDFSIEDLDFSKSRVPNPIKNLADEKVFKTLRRISDIQAVLSAELRYTQKVYRAELNHRVSLGLIGDDAIKHFNNWMVENGLPHLCVK